ncbi:hypothetical protein EV207_12419 [Scopulibacillus darangshiensis]|uniref:Gas vesicle protein n=1 Tax=Scopulibacillus darangshiensis TaxID=442528 RepID=A0A4R2NRN6_9BACL|nr:YtxH domain-containing protein [Scopulibacillus darangshiensis]TCP24520.1 hypothetical protein EV207_12419 [Scopulibacillus darangshiensis]
MSAYQKSKLGKFMLIGGIVGAAVSLFDRGTRACIKNGMGAAKTNGGKFVYSVRNNPEQVSNYFKTAANNLKMAAKEVSQDMKEMAEKVNSAKNSTTDAYRYAVEAGDEISQISHKIRNSGQSMMKIDTSKAATSSATLPSATSYTTEASQELADSPPTSFEATTWVTPEETESITSLSTPEETITTLSVEEDRPNL